MELHTTPFWAKCKCGHLWVCAYTPMELRTMAKMLRNLMCPKCGLGAKDITPAKQKDGVLLEAA